VAAESLRRGRAGRQAKQAMSRAAQSEREAILGRYMAEMKHNVSNALTSILATRSCCAGGPGQLSAQSLQQIKNRAQHDSAHHEIMQAILIAGERDAGG